MRSKLFVPGSRPELFAKALASEADAISIDLEDSVVASRKKEARAHVVDFLQSADALSGSKVIIVRCNASGTENFEADIDAIAQPGLKIVNVPKVESVTDVRVVVEALEQAEASNGVVEPVDILVTIESPAGLRRASKIANAHPRVVGLQLGLNDLFESLNMDRKDAASIHSAMFALRLAAGEAGVYAIDGAYADTRDEQGFRTEAEMARRLGFCGKSCIYPSQVALANEVFMPSDDEVAAAIRVLEQSHEFESRGIGAFTLDGRMIDLPVIRRAETLLATSRRLRGTR